MSLAITLSPSFTAPATRFSLADGRPQLNRSWTGMPQKLRKTSKICCLFSDNRKRKQEQARISLESALGGKKSEFEKWDKEIKKKEQLSGGSDGGGGGWFGWGRWFGGSGDDHFWQETQQTTLTILAIVFMFNFLEVGLLKITSFRNGWPLFVEVGSEYPLMNDLTILILAKGDVMLALVFNPLLFALRGIRSGLTFGSSQILSVLPPSLQAKLKSSPKDEVFARESAKERVVRKWGSG